jgi:hypothetical protein
VTYATIDAPLPSVTANGPNGRHRNHRSTNNRIAEQGIFIGLWESYDVIRSHLALNHSQIMPGLTPAYGKEHRTYSIRANKNRTKA